MQEEKDRSQELIFHHLDYARGIARQFYRTRRALGIDEEDFVASALLGLCDAAKRFDSSRAESFSTYSYLRIRGAIFDMLRTLGRFPLDYVRAEVAQKRRDKGLVVDEEKAKPKHFSPPLAWKSKELSSVISSIDELAIDVQVSSRQGPATLMYRHQETIEQLLVRNQSRRELWDAVEKLPPKERAVIYSCFGDEAQSAAAYQQVKHMTRGWVSRLRKRGLQRLSRMLQEPKKSLRRNQQRAQVANA